MKHFTRIFALAVLLAAAPLAAAQQPSEARVDRLLEVMRAKETLDATLLQLHAMQQQMVAQMTADQELDEEERAGIDRALEATNKTMVEVLTWERMGPLYRDIYAQTFTADDVEAMIGFYESPAGQNTLDKMPQLMQNTMNAVQQLVVPLLQQLEQDIAAELGD